MIDEKELIMEIANWQESLVPHNDTQDKIIWDTLESVIKTISEQSKVDEWILCSERLPEGKVNPISNDYYEYPVTVDFNGTLDVRYYKFGDGHWWHGGKCMDDYVIAWMPKPEPWEGVRDVI